MSTLIDRFFIAVGLKTDDVEKGMNDLNKKMTSGFKEIAASVAAPLVGALSVGSLFSDFITEATNVDKLSKSLGVNVETMHAWMGAAEELGADGDEMAELFHDINDWASDLVHNDSGTLKEFMERGLIDTVTDAQGKLLSTEDLIYKVSDAMEKLGPEEASGLLRRLGVGNKDLAGLISQGSGQLATFIQRQKELGVYTKEDTETARKFSMSLYELTRAFKMSLVPVLTWVTPLISKFGEIATNTLIKVRKHPIILKTLFAGLATIMLTKVVPAIKTMTMAMLRNPLTIIIASLIMLGVIVEDFFGYLDGKKTAFGEFWSYFGTAEEIKAGFMAIWETLQGMVQSISEFKITDYISPEIIQVIIDAMSDLIGIIIAIGMQLYELGKVIVKAFTSDKPSPFINALKKIIQLIIAIIGGVTSIVIALATSVGAALGLILELITNIIAYFTDGEGAIKDIFEGICDFISGFCDFATSLISALCRGIVGFFRSAAQSVFGIFDSIGDKIGSLKQGLLSVIGLSKDANRVAASGKGGGNTTSITDNSTTNNWGYSSNPSSNNGGFKLLVPSSMGGVR